MVFARTCCALFDWLTASCGPRTPPSSSAISAACSLPSLRPARAAFSARMRATLIAISLASVSIDCVLAVAPICYQRRWQECAETRNRDTAFRNLSETLPRSLGSSLHFAARLSRRQCGGRQGVYPSSRICFQLLTQAVPSVQHISHSDGLCPFALS